MHIEEPEDLRLGEPEGVPHRSGFERRVFRQLDDELHAQRPLAPRVTGRQAEALVEPLADRAYGAVAHHSELRAHIHAGHIALGRDAVLVHSLIGQAKSGDCSFCPAGVLREDGTAHRRSRPDLDEAGGHELRGDPLVELADRQHQPAVLVQEDRRPGQFESGIFDPQRFSKAKEKISHAQRERTPAGADGIEQVEHALLPDRSRHGNLGGIQRGKACANSFGARNHAADACGQVVGALVAEHLQRHARRNLAFECGIGGILAPCLGQRGQKAARGRTKACADDVHVHRLAVDFDCLGRRVHAAPAAG